VETTSPNDFLVGINNICEVLHRNSSYGFGQRIAAIVELAKSSLNVEAQMMFVMYVLYKHSSFCIDSV
jgi:hypothetical protein